MDEKRVRWAADVVTPPIKRPCECMFCMGCKTNSMCEKFGPFYCQLCEEWRCALCFQEESNVCTICSLKICPLKIPDNPPMDNLTPNHELLQPPQTTSEQN